MLGVLPRALAVLEMRQDALDHGGVFDAGDDLHLSATGLAGLDIDLEYALQTLRPCHCRMAGRWWVVQARGLTRPAAGRGHLLVQMMVGGEYAVIAGKVDARIGDQGFSLKFVRFHIFQHIPLFPSDVGDIVTYPQQILERPPQHLIHRRFTIE